MVSEALSLYSDPQHTKRAFLTPQTNDLPSEGEGGVSSTLTTSLADGVCSLAIPPSCSGPDYRKLRGFKLHLFEPHLGRVESNFLSTPLMSLSPGSCVALRQTIQYVTERQTHLAFLRSLV